MATIGTINITLDSSCDCGPHDYIPCPYCHQDDPDPETHMARVHPLPGWWLRQQQNYIDRIVAAHEAVGSPYFGIRSVASA